MRKLSALLLSTAFVSSLMLQPAVADDWHRHGDIRYYHEHEDHWRLGSWYNGYHDGRLGWWWIVDGYWYYYPSPVYPFPDPNAPTVIIEPAPTVATQSFYWYCPNPAGYYPTVPLCPVHWRKVIPSNAVVVPPQAQVIAQPPQAPIESSREVDMKKLDGLHHHFDEIDSKDSHAASKLNSLEKQVEDFRNSLYKRDYNAMDLLKDSEQLKTHIEEKKSWLAEKHSDAVPPGTTVTFPPAKN